MSDNELILVTGATGTVGREAVRLLAEAGRKVRAVVRDPSKTEFHASVEIVQGDLSRPETLEKAFKDAAKVLVIANYPDLKELEINAFEAAAQTGVRHVVKLSALEAFQEHMAGTGHAQTHIDTERRLRESGLPWTMVRPGFFASNFLFFVDRAQSTVFLPAGEGKEAPVHPRDIAEVSVKILTTPGHEGKIYEFTGPELLSYSELVEGLSAATGKRFRYFDVTEEDARNRMLAANFPPILVEGVLSHFAGAKKGRIKTEVGVFDVLGRSPLTFTDWARENAGAFI